MRELHPLPAADEETRSGMQRSAERKFVLMKTLTPSVKAGPNAVNPGTLTSRRCVPTVTTTDAAETTGVAGKAFAVKPRR